MPLPEIHRQIHGRSIGLSSSNQLIVNQRLLEKSTVCQALVEHVAVVVVPTASVLILNGTPYEILPDPGAGKAWIPRCAALSKPAGTAYAGIGSAEDLEIVYGDLLGEKVIAECEATGFLDQTNAEHRFCFAPSHATSDGAIVIEENSNLVLRLSAGDITTGDSDLTVKIWAELHDIPFA